MIQTKNLTARAYAKINLSLDIVSKMDDGYHALQTVMQSVGFYDEIDIRIELGNGKLRSKKQNIIKSSTNLKYIPNDDKNIAVRAARAFFKHTKIAGYVTKMKIRKNIPVCAGLGGGSADAACVLRMLAEMFEKKLSRKDLEAIALMLGADVPFCVTGGTKLAEGRGEIMTDLTPLPQFYVVLCKPPFGCSTPELFEQVDIKKIRTRPDTAGLLEEIEKGSKEGIARYMYNVFEDVLPHGKKEIEEIKSQFLDCGALGSVMTGSGPTVFGLFDDALSAGRAHAVLSKNYEDCFLTKTVSSEETTAPVVKKKPKVAPHC